MATDFERLYYEDENFWIDSLEDNANKNRIQRTSALIPDHVTSLVDLGCGNGVFLNFLINQGKKLELLGVDRSKVALTFVKSETMEAGISELPLPDKRFDCVTCLEVIEHLPHGVYEKALEEIARVSKEYIIISVPYKEDLERSFNQCPSCKSSFSYELHLRSFDDEKMKSLMLPFGFECVKTEYLGEQQSFLGHELYRKMLYPEQRKEFLSPICPICGYKKEQKKTSDTGGEAKKVQPRVTAKQRIISVFSSIPKMVWPKEVHYYWILALYRKK